MKLSFHPASTTRRPLMLFAADVSAAIDGHGALLKGAPMVTV